MAGHRQIDYDEAVRLYKDGHTYESIAKSMGVSPSTVGQAVNLARKKGKLPPKPHPTMRQVMDKRGIKIGALGDVINNKLTRDELEWLMGRLSNDKPTLADVIIDLVIEAASVDEDDDT